MRDHLGFLRLINQHSPNVQGLIDKGFIFSLIKGNQSLPSPKLTYHLKMDGWNTSFLSGRPIFRGELLVSGSTTPPNHQAGYSSRAGVRDHGWLRSWGRAILGQLRMYALTRNVQVDNWYLGGNELDLP